MANIMGNDVWIGYQALIMPGIKIGNVSIISSRSAVTSDVPTYSIIGGNPARVIKKRFTDENILALEKLAWWDWPVEKITLKLTAIMSADIGALLDE